PVSRKLAVLVDRCLAKEPDQRPASAEALAEQLGLAIALRRELPVALRAFARDGGRLNGPGTIIVPFLLLGVTVGISTVFGSTVAYGTMAALGIAAPVAYLINAARRLLRLGFTQADLEPAFRVQLEQAREEHGVRSRTALARYEVPLKRAAQAFGLAWGASIIAISAAPVALLRFIHYPRWGLMAPAVAAIGTVASTIGYLALVRTHEDADTAFWRRVWTGRVGRVLFSVARRLPGRRQAATVTTHRATELALGMAAENLFESLPRATRASLASLPAILLRLQEDAQHLRSQYNELQDALAEAPGGAMSEAYADVRETRDAIQGKLTEAVSALETIRLNLLRLHAGSATIEGLTTHLEMAADVSAEVQRLLAAHEEVERHLEFPREIAGTPA
ncbi:MAG: hypothetical protein ACREN3_04235, partial [Gemmatimonadaceae bacterium]